MFHSFGLNSRRTWQYEWVCFLVNLSSAKYWVNTLLTGGFFQKLTPVVGDLLCKWTLKHPCLSKYQQLFFLYLRHLFEILYMFCWSILILQCDRPHSRHLCAGEQKFYYKYAIFHCAFSWKSRLQVLAAFFFFFF